MNKRGILVIIIPYSPLRGLLQRSFFKMRKAVRRRREYKVVGFGSAWFLLDVRRIQFRRSVHREEECPACKKSFWALAFLFGLRGRVHMMSALELRGEGTQEDESST